MIGLFSSAVWSWASSSLLPLILSSSRFFAPSISGDREKDTTIDESRPTKEAGAWRPRKKLGQHFLRDRSIVHRITSTAGFLPTSHVLEVGPGMGALTLPLAGSVGHIYAVEKDGKLVERLESELHRRSISNVTLIHEDILKMKFEDLPLSLNDRMGVIGNLPYNISTPLLERLLENRERIGRAVLMFQMEVARRLIAPPGNKEYGSLSVLLQYHAHISPLLEVSRRAFYPVPKVILWSWVSI